MGERTEQTDKLKATTTTTAMAKDGTAKEVPPGDPDIPDNLSFELQVLQSPRINAGRWLLGRKK
jgi:hypothetical protein